MQRRLSATEARLARLIAAGSSDDQIVARLALDQVAIERHLAGVYRKLGVRSRTELAVLMGSQEEGLT